MIVVARGGGSLADLFAFCDETLCRTVALLRVPVIASVGHHTDRTLIDDVAAVACSTPDARRRGRRAASTAPRRARALRGLAARLERRAGARSSSAPARSRGCRARPPTTSRATARACTSSCASCARAPAGGVRRERAPARRARDHAAARLARKARARRRARRARAQPAARDLERLRARARRPRPAAHARARLRARRGRRAASR